MKHTVLGERLAVRGLTIFYFLSFPTLVLLTASPGTGRSFILTYFLLPPIALHAAAFLPLFCFCSLQYSGITLSMELTITAKFQAVRIKNSFFIIKFVYSSVRKKIKWIFKKGKPDLLKFSFLTSPLHTIFCFQSNLTEIFRDCPSFGINQFDIFQTIGLYLSVLKQ